VMRLGPFGVSVVFHPPLDPRHFPSRKLMAQEAHAQVAAGLEACIRGADLNQPPLLRAQG
jgi:hypothetical protein